MCFGGRCTPDEYDAESILPLSRLADVHVLRGTTHVLLMMDDDDERRERRRRRFAMAAIMNPIGHPTIEEGGIKRQ